MTKNRWPDVETGLEAKAFQRRRYVALAARLGLSALYFGGLILSGGHRELARVAAGLVEEPTLAVLGYGWFILGFHYLLQSTLSYFTGFRVGREFGLTTQTPAGWLKDRVLGLVLQVLLLGGATFLVLFHLLKAAGPLWWLWASGLWVVFFLLMANLAPVLVMPLFNRFTPLDDEELSRRLARMVERAGVRVRGVYSMDMSRRTTAANAMLTGLGNTRRIILGDTLLDNFSADEIETVLAHELGHHARNHIVRGIAGGALLVMTAMFLSSRVLSPGLQQALTQLATAGVEWPLLSLVPAAILLLGIVATLALPLQNTVSRWYEVESDQFALEVTDKPQALAWAMAKLGQQNLAEYDPPWAVETLLYTHPSLVARIRHARQFAAAASHSEKMKAMRAKGISPQDIGPENNSLQNISLEDSRPLIVAHRGASGYAPENTLAAFGASKKLGADFIELDVTLSLDDEVIVIHDDTVDRTTNGTGRVDQLTLADLRKLDAGAWWGPEFAGESIPTLAEVLELARGEDIGLYIEVKPSKEKHPMLTDKVIDLVREGDMAKRVVIQSFDPQVVTRVLQRMPEASPQLLTFKPAFKPEGRAIRSGAVGYNPWSIWLAFPVLGPWLIQRLKTAGLTVSVWTVNSPTRMKALAGLGVDAIITDLPDVALRATVRQEMIDN